MSVSFLHGIETIETTNITSSVTEVKSAVIGLIGTAPQGPVNTPTLVSSAADAATFGDVSENGITSGYSIPYALSAIQEYGAGTIVVVNVFQPTTPTNITDEALTFSNGVGTLAHTQVSNVVVKSTDGNTTFVADTDYTVAASTGKITVVADEDLENVSSVKVSYTYAAANTLSSVTASSIIGSTDTNGNRTGAQALKDTFSLFGFNPKIIIAPGFSSTTSVLTALVTLATSLRAVVLADMPDNLTVSQAVAARGTTGDNLFNTTSDRVYLLYPKVKHYDAETETDQLMPYSVTMAGLIAKTDRDSGYWHSPSNKALVGVTGLERNITSSYTDSTTDVQLLNEKGITSVMNSYGSGYRAYGNRLASYIGTDKGLATFLVSRRVCDMIAESLEQAMADFIDSPLTNAIINDILAVGNGFINTLVARGALVGGSCYVNSADNSASDLAQGKLKITYEYNPPAPLERITHTLVLTNSYYEE